MPRVVFTSNLQRHVACPESDVAGETVAQALTAVFALAPQVRIRLESRAFRKKFPHTWTGGGSRTGSSFPTGQWGSEICGCRLVRRRKTSGRKA